MIIQWVFFLLGKIGQLLVFGGLGVPWLPSYLRSTCQGKVDIFFNLEIESFDSVLHLINQYMSSAENLIVLTNLSLVTKQVQMATHCQRPVRSPLKKPNWLCPLMVVGRSGVADGLTIAYQVIIMIQWQDENWETSEGALSSMIIEFLL